MGETEEVLDVVDARIPILKLKFNGFQIDLLFAQIEASLLDSKKSIEKLIKD